MGLPRYVVIQRKIQARPAGFNLFGESRDAMDVESIWEEYSVQLKNFLVPRVSQPEDAEDLLQEILIKTHKNLDSIREPGKFKSWLYQISRNTLFDYYRKQRPNISIQEIPEIESVSEMNLDKNRSVFSELGECIKPFLMELPEKYRLALEETDLNGKSQKAYAEELGLSHSTLKSRVRRGRAMLSDIFHECCSYEIDARGNVMGYEQQDCC